MVRHLRGPTYMNDSSVDESFNLHHEVDFFFRSLLLLFILHSAHIDSY